MRTFIENYLHFMKNCIRPHYEKLKSLKSGFIENLIFENNRDPWSVELLAMFVITIGCKFCCHHCSYSFTLRM